MVGAAECDMLLLAGVPAGNTDVKCFFFCRWVPLQERLLLIEESIQTIREQDKSSCLVLRNVTRFFLAPACRWVPLQERSRSLAMVYSGMYAGSIAGLSLSPHMVQGLGWPSVFFIFGSLGVVWFALWQSKAESSPSQDKRVSEQERAYIKGNTVEPVGLKVHGGGGVCDCVWV